MSSPDPFTDPHLVHACASAHPEVTTLDAAGLSRIGQAEGAGLVPLGLPLPKGKRDLLVPAERREAILLEIGGTIDRAQRRDALLAQGRRALEGRRASLHPAGDRILLRAVLEDGLR